MKYSKLLSRILLTLIVVGIAIGLSIQVETQGNAVTYLEERYKQQNIPVTEITVLQESPLRLQIVFQTTSDGKVGTPDDPINYHLIEREVVLAATKGYFIQSFVTILINPKGEQVFKSDTPVYADPKSLEIAPSRITDAVTKSMVNNDLNLYGMSLTSMEVSSSDGLQFLTLEVSSSSLVDANRAGPQLVGSLPKLIDDINAQGAQIEICRLEIRDEKGDILLNYLLDIQLRSQSWWADKNFTDTWSFGPP